MNITIKPHHLLDIFKLYGRGLKTFVPDETYHHDFYRIANAVVNCEIDNVTFTYGADDICRPCKCLKDGIYIDTFSYHGIPHQKNSYNVGLDQRLLQLLHLEADKAYPFQDVMKVFDAYLNRELIDQVWKSCDQSDNAIRYRFTREGINAFLEEYGLG